MAQAKRDPMRSPIQLHLSSLFRDRFVADAFRRAEEGGLPAILPERPLALDGGAAERLPETTEPEGAR
jgi:hypothetical protein